MAGKLVRVAGKRKPRRVGLGGGVGLIYREISLDRQMEGGLNVNMCLDLNEHTHTHTHTWLNSKIDR